MEFRPEVKTQLAKMVEKLEREQAEKDRVVRERLRRAREDTRVLSAINGELQRTGDDLRRILAKAAFAREYLLSREDGHPRPTRVDWNPELFLVEPSGDPENEFVRALGEFAFVALSENAMAAAFHVVVRVCGQLYPEAEIESYPLLRALRLIHPTSQDFPLSFGRKTKASSTVMVRLLRRDGGLLVSMAQDIPLPMLETLDNESGMALP